MFTINGTKVKSGTTFMKKGGRTKFVVSSVHRNGDVTYITEKNFGRFNGLGGGAVRVTQDVFKNDIFKSFAKGQHEIRLENLAARRAEDARREAVNKAHAEALRLDILVDATRGVATDELLARLEAVIAGEKEVSFEEGYDEAKDTYQEHSYNTCSYC